MPVNSSVLLASVNSVTGNRITSFEVTVPVSSWIDILTHRLLSRNCSSTRAIPMLKMRDAVIFSPAFPIKLTQYQKGMAANEPVTPQVNEAAREVMDTALWHTIDAHRKLEYMGISKQDANPLLLPYLHHRAIITATQLKNFFKLRNNENARPDLQVLAEMMELQYHQTYTDGEYQTLKPGQWHLPYITQDDLETYGEYTCRRISVARCARVSYKMNDGGSNDFAKDVELCQRLSYDGHFSPFEHQAVALPHKYLAANFVGWLQYRKLFDKEHNDDLSDVIIADMETIKNSVHL